MGEKTHISWADGTFNPWIGCTKVSVGEKGACVGCYAEALATGRLQLDVWGNKPRHRTAESTWKKPLAWNKAPAKHLWKGEGAPPADWRPFVFCASLADVFDNQVPPEWRRDLFDLIRATPNLTWLLLTKRPQNIVRLFLETVRQIDVSELLGSDLPRGFTAIAHDGWPSNAAIGCTAVTQDEWDRDMPTLAEAKSLLRPAFSFVSIEPMMGGIDGRVVLSCASAGPDWIITGGETDQGHHKARPSRLDWFRSLRDQCAQAGTPFLFKQHGEHQGGARVGKRAPGWDLLDGQRHDARPRSMP